MRRSTVARVLSRYRETGSYHRRLGQDQSRITTNRKNLCVPSRNERQIRDVALSGRKISAQTIRYLRKIGLCLRIRARVPMLAAMHR